MLWQCFTPLSFTFISSHNKIILKFPKFPNISQNSENSHKINNIPGGLLQLSKFPGILHPYSSVCCEKSHWIWTGKKLPGIGPNCHSRSGALVKSVPGPGEISVANVRIYPLSWATLKLSAAGFKKNCWAGDLLLGSFEVACRGQKCRFAAVVLWRFGNTDMNHHDQFWSIHFWQHGFSIRGAITNLFTNRQFFYHLNSTSSWQPKVRTFLSIL